MPACQSANVLGKRATSTCSVQALEAPHLHGEQDMLVQDGAFGQTTGIASVQPAAPAAARRTRCNTHRTASLHVHRAPPLGAAEDPLTHTGENAVDDPSSSGHVDPARKVASGRNQALALERHTKCGRPALAFLYGCGTPETVIVDPKQPQSAIKYEGGSEATSTIVMAILAGLLGPIFPMAKIIKSQDK